MLKSLFGLTGITCAISFVTIAQANAQTATNAPTVVPVVKESSDGIGSSHAGGSIGRFSGGAEVERTIVRTIGALSTNTLTITNSSTQAKK